MNTRNETAWIKAILLSKSYIKFSDNLASSLEMQKGNLHKKEWVFLRLNENSRVRLIYDENAELLLQASQNGTYQILDIRTNTIIANNAKIEKVLAHAPEQLFFVLYKRCSMGCKFCPLTTRIDNAHYSLDQIYSRIKSVEKDEIKSIGLTSASPPNLSTNDIVDEMIFLIEKIRKVIRDDTPIGVSVKTPSKEELKKLKKHGVHEIRLNLEIYNDKLSQELMPMKRKDNILRSIQDACDIFGSGFVTSNMLVGIGESDDDLMEGIEMLAKFGAVATLYPYDPIENTCNMFERPSAERLYSLAVEQKKIFMRHKLDTTILRTMCGFCAASHIFPGKDL